MVPGGRGEFSGGDLLLNEPIGVFRERQLALDHGTVVNKTLEEAQVAAATKRLAELIREGLESGEPVEVNDAYWKGLQERIENEVERRRSA